MSKRVIVAVVVIALVVLGVVLIGRKDNTSTNSNNTTSSNNQPQQSSGAQVSNTNSVAISNMQFSPDNITVKKGTTVTWTNNDGIPHTVTESDDQSGPSSPTLSSGQTYSFTFNTAGTFKYHCTIHPGMTGTVTVTE